MQTYRIHNHSAVRWIFFEKEGPTKIAIVSIILSLSLRFFKSIYIKILQSGYKKLRKLNFSFQKSSGNTE